MTATGAYIVTDYISEFTIPDIPKSISPTELLLTLSEQNWDIYQWQMSRKNDSVVEQINETVTDSDDIIRGIDEARSFISDKRMQLSFYQSYPNVPAEFL